MSNPKPPSLTADPLSRKLSTLSVGLWRPELGLVEVLVIRNKVFQKASFSRQGKTFLFPEEALALLRLGSLELLHEERALSIQEGFACLSSVHHGRFCHTEDCSGRAGGSSSVEAVEECKTVLDGIRPCLKTPLKSFTVYQKLYSLGYIVQRPLLFDSTVVTAWKKSSKILRSEDQVPGNRKKAKVHKKPHSQPNIPVGSALGRQLDRLQEWRQSHREIYQKLQTVVEVYEEVGEESSIVPAGGKATARTPAAQHDTFFVWQPRRGAGFSKRHPKTPDFLAVVTPERCDPRDVLAPGALGSRLQTHYPFLRTTFCAVRNAECMFFDFVPNRLPDISDQMFLQPKKARPAKRKVPDPGVASAESHSDGPPPDPHPKKKIQTMESREDKLKP